MPARHTWRILSFYAPNYSSYYSKVYYSYVLILTYKCANYVNFDIRLC